MILEAFAAALLFVTPSTADSLADYADRLDAFGFAGQLVVEEDGQVVLDRSIGLADRRTRAPVTRETIFGLGSITKTFTAAATLRLVSKGRVHLADRLDALLPNVPGDKAAITVDQLLSHRAGLRLDADLPDEATRDQVVRLILAQPLGWAPGEGFHYSNIGFDLLAAIVERRAGTDYDSFVRRELLEPAGMAHTGRAGVARLARFPAARGETEWGEATALREWPEAWHGTGAGRMVSNAPDLLRWGHALRDGKVLAPRERDLMFAAHAAQNDSASYGYGMQRIARTGGSMLYFHGGDVPGYRSELRIEPAADRYVVVVTNQDIWGEGFQRRVIGNTLARLAAGEAPRLPPDATFPLPDDPVLGSWLLPGGGRIEITERDGRMRVAARGQDAIDLFDPREALAERAQATRDARVLLDRAAARDTSAGGEAMRFLVRGLDRVVARYGPIDSVEVLGSVTSPFVFQGTRTYFRVHVEAGTRGGYLAFQDGALDDVTLGDDRPAPVLLPAAPLEDGGYATFDLLRSRAVPFALDRSHGIDVLVVGEAVARRAP
jgi:CubicO group peptidase (beta-lactamase class C family)